MGAQQKRPLRQLTPQEREELSQKATSAREQVIMGKKSKSALSCCGWTCTFTEAGRQVGISRDGVSQLVERFHQRGVEVLSIAPGRGRKPTYTSQDHKQYPFKKYSVAPPGTSINALSGHFPFCKSPCMPKDF